jgi:hypothetical protein
MQKKKPHIFAESCLYEVVGSLRHAFTSPSCSLREKSSLPIFCKCGEPWWVVTSNQVHGQVYSIQNYVIKFVSDLGQVGGFLWFPQPIKRTAMIYNWNNVESGVKHYKPTKPDVYHKLNIEVDFCSTTL